MVKRIFEATKNIKQFLYIYVINILFIGCYSNSQDTPESMINTYASSISAMDIESAVSCFEYGEEMSAFMSGISVKNYNIAALQDVVYAAKGSELLPEISYEIMESNINDEKGNATRFLLLL